jgi:uncharacterized iron-regulated protein
MKKLALTALSVLVLLCGFASADKLLNPRIYDLNHQRETVMSDVLPALKQNRIIIVGELHGEKSHHEAQLNVIQALKKSGIQVAIGLEMFRSDSQPLLDRWVAGNIGEAEFQEVFYDNWGYSWANYRVIFDYAKEEKVKMIGLNVPRDITRQVSLQGFKSLNEEQKGKLSNITCRVDKEYMDYIKKAFGGHAHGNLNFTYFCEAQLVWDTVMAINALDYLSKNPNALVVVLTGTGHARKNAIPRQIRERSEIAYTVILPEIKGAIDPETVDRTDADYIMLGL